MSNYTKATNFATKDALPTGNALKIVSGTEIDTEFSNIETAVNTKADTSAMTAADALKANIASPTFTGVPAAPTATAGTNTTQVATTAFAKAAADAAGKVLQVVTDKIASTFSTSSQNVFVTTGQSLAITPSSTSSKILIMFSAKSVKTVAANTAIHIEVRRSGTTVTQGGYYTAQQAGNQTVPFGVIHTLDSPSTASEVTYEVFASEGGVAGTVSLNGPREITLMEIAG